MNSNPNTPVQAGTLMRDEGDAADGGDRRHEPRTSSRGEREGARRGFEEGKALYEAGLWISRDNPRSAIAHFLQAGSVFGELKGQERRRDKSLWQAGVCFGRVGCGAKNRKDWSTATEAFQEALNLFVEIGDSEKEATTLYQLSLVSCDLLSASDYLKKAILLYVDLGDEPKEAMCLAELGNLFGKSLKDPASALFHWKQALLLYTKLQDRDKEAKALYSIAEILNHGIVDRNAAYDQFFRARHIFQSLNDRTRWEANCCYQLGKVCVAEKRYESAVQFFEEASTLFRRVEGSETDEAWSLYRLALVMLKVRSKDLAVDYLTEARRLFERDGDERQAQGSCLFRLAEIFKASNPPMAKTLLGEALELVDPVKERIGRKSTLVLETLQRRSIVSAQHRDGEVEASEREFEQRLSGRNGGELEESWSFTGATEEGGARDDDPRPREKEVDNCRSERERDNSQGGEGAWWAI